MRFDAATSGAIESAAQISLCVGTSARCERSGPGELKRMIDI
jgi:hypothetical protein